ncbi:MAG TPA: aminotransferase class V-fold PLP-dependent enzyme [Methanocorpusculum sp.]|nr:aminotransferase class V-fold PLP-dependent enzyme [Methanocorpusculum sp.]
MIYLDNAATTLKKPQEVIDAVVTAMQSIGNSSRGTHSAGVTAAETIYAARVKLASFFGCSRPDHVIFTSNVTESLNTVINGLFSPGDHVIATEIEHNSVLRPLYHLEEEAGLELDFLPADKNGVLQYAVLPSLLRKNTKAVIASHASNVTGNLTDICAISKFTRQHGLLFILDAAQTAGCIPVNMAESGVDILCFTGHKGLLGPQGTGGICIREGIEIRPFKVGGTGVQSYEKHQPSEYPTRLEAGTLNGHGIAGLSAAIDYLNRISLAEIHTKEIQLMNVFYQEMKKLSNVSVYGDFSGDRTAIVSINIRGMDSAAVSFLLSEKYGIATRPGAHCAPKMHEALGTVETGVVRFSFSWFTTFEEVNEAVRAVKEIAEEYGS